MQTESQEANLLAPSHSCKWWRRPSDSRWCPPHCTLSPSIVWHESGVYGKRLDCQIFSVSPMRRGPCLCWLTAEFQCVALTPYLLNAVVHEWGCWCCLGQGQRAGCLAHLSLSQVAPSVSFLFSKCHCLLFPEASVLACGQVPQPCGFCFPSFTPERRQNLFQIRGERAEINTDPGSGIFLQELGLQKLPKVASSPSFATYSVS